MPSWSVPTEIEIKLAAPPNLAALRTKLRSLGFSIHKRRVFEANTVFDNSRSQLRKANLLLRLREVGQECILTYKGPPQPGVHKSREEIETHLSSCENFREILKRLGYVPNFRYEKFRTEYHKPPQMGVVTVDETPIGNFLELEGPGRWIDSTAKALGFSANDYITMSYGALYLTYCRAHNTKPTHMVFPK